MLEESPVSSSFRVTQASTSCSVRPFGQQESVTFGQRGETVAFRKLEHTTLVPSVEFIDSPIGCLAEGPAWSSPPRRQPAVEPINPIEAGMFSTQGSGDRGRLAFAGEARPRPAGHACLGAQLGVTGGGLVLVGHSPGVSPHASCPSCVSLPSSAEVPGGRATRCLWPHSVAVWLGPGGTPPGRRVPSTRTEMPLLKQSHQLRCQERRDRGTAQV